MNATRPRPMRELLADAAAYWERRRIAFNATLIAVVVAWVVLTWPQFRDGLTPRLVLLLFVLVLAANVGYSAVYLLDVPAQRSSFADTWRSVRRSVWLLITAAAILLTNYWIADEIYPYLGQ